MSPIERFVSLKWPLFRKALGYAQIPPGSFNENQTPDEREDAFRELVGSFSVTEKELTAAIDKLRPRSPSEDKGESPIQPNSQMVSGKRKIDLVLEFIKSIDKTTTDLYSHVKMRWQ